MCSSRGVDLALRDIAMPDHDGFQAKRRIGAQIRTDLGGAGETG
jgi:CheY-like chemotaxis protein